jgi:adenosylhomocysteine nucleosidase
MVGVVCALEAEARHFDSQSHSLVALAGMGISAAARAAEDLARAPVQALVSFGMAGGLDPALTAGTVCLPDMVVAADGSATPTAKDWAATVAQTFRRHWVVRGGRLISVSEPVATAEGKAALFRKTGAQAVDMESAGIARVAAAAGLPFLVLRVITDTADDSLPTAVLTAMREKKLRYAGVLGGVLMTPREIPDVVRLAWRYRAAHRTLRHLAACLELAR